MKKNLIEADGLGFYVGDKVKLSLEGTEDKQDIKDFWKLAFNRRCSDRNRTFKIVRIRYKQPDDPYVNPLRFKVEYDGQISAWVNPWWFTKI